MPHPFVLFGTDHLTVLALAFAAPAILSALTWRNDAAQKMARMALAAVLTGNWIFWCAIFWRNGWLTLGDALPLNLCDWANACVILALITKNQRAFELGYFWAIAGTLQGLLTPDTRFDFPEVRFIIFSIFHGGIIASVLYLIAAARMRPYPSSMPRVAIASLTYLAVAGIADWLLGTNYGFLRAKPVNVSLLQFMPDWPSYIPLLVVIGIASMFVCYAPFFAWDRIRSVRQARA